MWKGLPTGLQCRRACLVLACAGAMGADWPMPPAPVPPFAAPAPHGTGIADQPPVIVPDPPPIHAAPEPATALLGLIGSGLAGVIARRRKRRAANAILR